MQNKCFHREADLDVLMIVEQDENFHLSDEAKVCCWLNCINLIYKAVNQDFSKLSTERTVAGAYEQSTANTRHPVPDK